MAQDPPGWYYVGNGRLRYKFGDFWTDQYKTIEHSERAVPKANIESSDPVLAHTSPNAGMPRLRTTRLIAVVCACLLGLGVGGGLLQPDIRHDLASWAAAKVKSTPAHPGAPHAPAAKPKTKVAEPPAAPAHAATKPPVTPPSSPPKSIPRSVTNPR